MKKLRAKLITLPWELEVPTLSLASLAAVTPESIEVAIVDVLREHLFFDEPTDLVGISASTPMINAAYALADAYRAKGVKVVMGGHHVTAMPEEGLLHADAVVCGEGEVAWQRICDEMLTHPAKVGGIYRERGPDLSTLPQPRVDLMKIERYGAYYYPIVASRGCPESCSFCFAKRMTRGYRTYPISHVIEQVRRRPKWVKALYFVDDYLPADMDWARELFRELAKVKIPFGMQARHEFSRDPENVHLAREAGCALISTGYESVNQSSLDNTGKRALASEYRDTIANVFNEGIVPSGNWMFGFDWDTQDTFRETLEFLDSTKLAHCSFTTEIPFPGTAAHQKYKDQGRIIAQSYDDYRGKDWVVVKPLGMTAKQLQEGVRWLATQFYSVGRATRRSQWAFDNARLASELGFFRKPMLMGLNYFQVWQWHYRMVPALSRFYLSMLKVYRYRYAKDLVRRTNYWSSPHERANPPAAGYSSDTPFLAAEGYKSGRAAGLKQTGLPGGPPPGGPDLFANVRAAPPRSQTSLGA